MRVGTISLNINAPDFNYGAVLHTWAFQTFLKTLPNIENVSVIDYTMPKLEGQDLARPIYNALRTKRVKSIVKSIITFKKYKSRYSKFYDFERKNLPLTKVKYTQKTLNDADLEYDVVICESDVIWSPGFSGGDFDKSFFLALDSMSQMKKIAYAPSMADCNMTEKNKQDLKILLKSLDVISCRESYEKEILSGYSDKEITQVLDPVMLLDAVDYEPITAKRLIENGYLLLYLPVDDNNQLREQANWYANKHKLKIIEINTKLLKKASKEVISYDDAGIEEFLSAIKYCDVLFTNSFHAICFAVIFKREFYAFSRKYAGKVKDICGVLGLEDRYFEDDVLKIRDPIDWPMVNVRVEHLKNISKHWLINALQ